MTHRDEKIKSGSIVVVPIRNDDLIRHPIELINIRNELDREETEFEVVQRTFSSWDGVRLQLRSVVDCGITLRPYMRFQLQDVILTTAPNFKLMEEIGTWNLR